ncbi:hypothetical protein OIU84_003711 [Salix udensis]|uniref:Uncharacterized protein n=1 Tax=Salix udensis TaxID=889485 RepID=A0AAD6P352_9ROSI|nr:hypothetical protein OIU84_003711 [Salix udensis]
MGVVFYAISRFLLAGFLLVAAARGGPMKWRLFNIVYKKVPQLEVSLILGYPQEKTKHEKTLNRPWTAWVSCLHSFVGMAFLSW